MYTINKSDISSSNFFLHSCQTTLHSRITYLLNKMAMPHKQNEDGIEIQKST